MAEIFKGVGKVLQFPLNNLSTLMGGKAPKSPSLLPSPSFNDNLLASAVAQKTRQKQLNANGRKGTLLSLTNDGAQAVLQNAPKSLLGG